MSPEYKLILDFGMQKSVLLPRIGMCLDYVPNFVSLERRSPLDRGLSKERFHCILVERGLVQGMRPVKQ